jgi:hypothetical protein
MQSMQEYVVRVRRTAEGEYRATVREVAPGVPLDVRTLPTGAAGIGGRGEGGRRRRGARVDRGHAAGTRRGGAIRPRRRPPPPMGELTRA